ncbi:hypothetical protein MMC09_003222 [Bachmanniomyces sp. S44760]|nr:hypothetical protein [Bachmanniomyces sp. S44760]
MSQWNDATLKFYELTAKIHLDAKSVHSRLAKRALSPSNDLDRSITSTRAPAEDESKRSMVLSTHHGARITKRKAKGKQLTRQQRRRHEKGMERAEAVMDKTETKVDRIVSKGKANKERRAAWDEFNSKIEETAKICKPNKSVDEVDEWEDEVVDTVDENRNGANRDIFIPEAPDAVA